MGQILYLSLLRVKRYLYKLLLANYNRIILLYVILSAVELLPSEERGKKQKTLRV